MKTFARARRAGTPQVKPARARHTAGTAAVLGAVVALAAACGSQAAPVNPGGPDRVASKPPTSLTIKVAVARGVTPRQWTLTCGPAGDGGSHPHPAAACAALDRARNPFAPVPHNVMCSMIYGGPQTASITGTWKGERVAATYSRVNGCQTARWNKIWQVLGTVNPGGPMIPASGGPPSG
jgi:hypothetical protein